MAAILPMSSICGASVLDSEGESLGTISELMVDSGGGAIVYAVLAYGGMMGVGEKLFAVPWHAFEVAVPDGEISLPVPRERLDELEGFDKDAWPTEADPAFG